MSTENLPVYSNGDNEQQTVCPQCGARTELLSFNMGVGIEYHKCLNPRCGYEFVLDLNDDEPSDEEE